VSNLFSNSGRSDQPIPTPDPKDLLLIPISFFEKLRDNGSKGFFADINRPVTWRELCDMLESFAEIPFKHKADAPLFSPTVFSGTRNVENSTVSAAVVIDADQGFDIRSAEHFLINKKIEAILYTMASNTDGSRFRVVVPLLAQVDPETHKAVVKAVCAFLKPGWKPDTSKANCYSLFYVPGKYAGAKNEFVHIEGAIFPAEAWLQLGGQASSDICSSPRLPTGRSRRSRVHLSSSGISSNFRTVSVRLSGSSLAISQPLPFPSANKWRGRPL
jgi:hypothetical protein